MMRLRIVGPLILGFWAATTPTVATELGPCDDARFGENARCGMVSVLEDRTQSDGRKIELHVVVLSAETPTGKDPVFFLAGGPGQGATDLVDLVRGVFASVLETRDIVLVDQRGTGGSNGLLCLNHSAEHPQRAFGGVFVPDEMAKCLKQYESRANVRLYTVEHAVADLEEVRARLGYKRALLWGGSGGTRTALVWMKRHPESIVAAVLDGVAPTHSFAPSRMARFSHQALSRVLEDCAAQESCAAAHPDLEASFRKLLWIFEGGPVKTHVTREDGTEVVVSMTRNDLAYALRAMLYRSQLIAKLPGAITHAAKTGDVSAFAQGLWRRDSAIRPIIAMGVHFASYCAEDVPFIDRRKVPELTAGTFLGTYLIDQYSGVCDIWKAGEVPRDFSQPTESDVPTLIFSGHYDPSTPESYGSAVARHLTNSRHVVVRNEAHGAGFGCGREAAVQVLTTGSLAGLGPTCEDVGPIEFEVPEG